MKSEKKAYLCVWGRWLSTYAMMLVAVDIADVKKKESK